MVVLQYLLLLSFFSSVSIYTSAEFVKLCIQAMQLAEA